ncbi:MAG: hypothetical protein B0A82_08610 [Alkalinema sp. CACIAM 70d]|nr:MAG: hypothetical protein B0A82_08610 [Alkalinema sp. CACIAM 70d]
MFRQVPLALLLLVVGGLLTVVGFYAYATDNATLNLAGFFYGIPGLLGGLALKAAELKPVPLTQPTSADVLRLRKQQATPTQSTILKDVTRYRYGQKAHLDSSLTYLGLSPTDEERPVLTGISETAVEGAYALGLEFDSPMIPFATWQEKQEKMTTYFGPGIRVQLDNPAENQVKVSLVAVPG